MYHYCHPTSEGKILNILFQKKKSSTQLVASKQCAMYFQTIRYLMTISSNDNSVNYELMLAPCSKVIRVCHRSLTKFQHVVLLPTQKHKTATREIENKKGG